jgi:HSP20 family protein
MDDYDSLLSNRPEGRLRVYAPSFDVRETDEAYQLDGELPGVEQKDIDIEFENEHCLNIKGHTQRESTSEDENWWASERSVGDFRRSFNFPTAVDLEHTHARLKNGVLHVTVPKSSSTKVTKKVAFEE